MLFTTQPETPTCTLDQPIKARIEWAVLFLMTISLLAVGLFSGLGQRFVVDEACYIEWGMLQQPVPGDWIGMKLISVVVIREGIGLIGSGLAALWALKVVFSLSVVAFSVGMFQWLKGDAGKGDMGSGWRWLQQSSFWGHLLFNTVQGGCFPRCLPLRLWSAGWRCFRRFGIQQNLGCGCCLRLHLTCTFG
ncbi:MAG: hypothetical protein ACFCU1_04850 [Sumerlaeia bacterium]